MIVVADSSPLRYLIALKQQELLPRIFGETWLPSAVVKELSAAGAPLEVREFLNHAPEWLKVRDPSKDALESINNELDVGERAGSGFGA
jgi:predicted nucleic acid-binding protein